MSEPQIDLPTLRDAIGRDVRIWFGGPEPSVLAISILTSWVISFWLADAYQNALTVLFIVGAAILLLFCRFKRVLQWLNVVNGLAIAVILAG
jgi:hypothetical protein